jgi:magnesium transporter
MGRIVAAYAYRDGSRIAEIQLGESRSWAGGKSDFVWIGFHEPTEHDLRVLQAQFGLHELAVEDALHAHQLPKVEIYGDSLFLVVRTAEMQDGRVAFGETHIFVGEHYIITVRHGASRSYSVVRERCESSPRLLSHGVDYVLHALLDYVVDNYQPVIKSMEEEVDAIEERILQGVGRLAYEDIERIYDLRRELVRLRRVATPMMEVCNRLRRIEMPFLDKEVRPYFRDVLDHVQRVNETIDALREVLSFAFEAAHLLESARQGDVSRRLAGWAAVIAVPTAIAGIYGMNFDLMPELHWRYGYPLALTLILGGAGYLYYRFRRSGWI